MKQSISILILSLFAILQACDDRVSDQRRISFWPPIEEESDSLITILESKAAHNKLCPADSTIANRIYQIGNQSDNNQLMCRGMYWKARVLSVEGLDIEPVKYAKYALCYCDTINYVYDHMRFRDFYMSDILSPEEQMMYGFKALNLFNNMGDSISSARMEGYLGDLLESIGDTANARVHYERGSDILHAMKLSELSVNADSRLALHHYRRNDFRTANTIFDTLLNKPDFKMHPGYLQFAHISRFMINNDLKDLRNALRLTDSLHTRAYNEPLIYALFSRYYMMKGMRDSAYHYIPQCMEFQMIIDNESPLMYRVLQETYLQEQNYDSAGIFYNKAEEIDSRLKLKYQNAATYSILLGQVSNMYDSRLESSHRHISLRNAVILSIIIVVSVLSLIIYLRVTKFKKYAEMELKHSRQLNTLSKLQLAERDKAISMIAETANANNEISSAVEEIRQAMTPETDWKRVELLFAEIDPKFPEALQKKFPDLTPAETRLACLIYLGLDNKHISRLLSIVPDSVKKTRQRLRAKLPIEPQDDLRSFLLKLV